MDQPLPQLQEGDFGTAVQIVQCLLSLYRYDPGGMDGQFGPNTLTAVQRFQSDRGIQADGIVGPVTWSKLAILMGPT